MKLQEIFDQCKASGRRPCLIASGNSGVVAVLGMEGRLFYGHDGEAVSLFRPEAAVNFSNSKTGYFNPGGDGLWPTPEGTTLGYEYSTGSWRVPVGLCNAQYELVAQEEGHLVMAAEVDLINNQQLGIPVRFQRDVRLNAANGVTIIEQNDSIEYIGARTLNEGEALLAPWSLSQYCVTPETTVAFHAFDGKVRDLYSPSDANRTRVGDRIVMRPDSAHRVQLALPEEAAFLELSLPAQKVTVRRTSEPLDDAQRPVDIADAAPDVPPSTPVRYSVYNDPSGFMELETVGGCIFPLTQGTVLRLRSRTVIASC